MKNSKVFEIESQIWNSVNDETRIGLLDGLSGIALFYSYLSDLYQDKKYTERLSKVVERIDELISEKQPLSSFCSGLAGYGWMLLNLKNDTIDISEGYFKSLDIILEEALFEYADKNEYDFLHEAMGIAMYFIERMKVKENDGNASEILNRFSKDLLYKLKHNFDEVTQSVEGDSKEKITYFGLAHGISGFINFLFYLSENIKLLENKINPILIKLINFMTSHKSFDKTSHQFYPGYIDGKAIVRKARLGWCQGDIGIGLALRNASKVLKDDQLVHHANELIISTEEISVETSNIKDFGICHGSAGILIQYYLAQKKHSLNTLNIKNKWFAVLENQTSNFSDFKRYYRGNYIKESNILEGSAGMLLVLLTIDSKVNADWLRCLNLY